MAVVFFKLLIFNCVRDTGKLEYIIIYFYTNKL